MTEPNDIVKTMATLHVASECFEALRQYASTCYKQTEAMKSTVLHKIAIGQELNEGDNIETAKRVLTESVENLMRKLRTSVELLNGFNRPGIEPIGVQLSLLDEIESDTKMIESVYDSESRKVTHRSGLIQAPIDI